MMDEQTGGTNVRFVQINIGHRIIAHDALMAWLCDQSNDVILCVQEPYFSKKGVPNIPKKYGAFWMDASEGRTRRAMIIAPRIYEGYMVTQNSCEDCVIVRFNHLHVSVASVYCAADRKMEDCIDGVIKEKEDRREIICCMDANAYHTLWGSDLKKNIGWAGKVRGIDLVYLLDMNELYVSNEVPHAPTFVRDIKKDSSHIDVTVTTGRMFNRIHKWRVTDEGFGSDHFSIQFSYNSEEGNKKVRPQVGIPWKKISNKKQSVIQDRFQKVFSRQKGKFRKFPTIEEDIAQHTQLVVSTLEKIYKINERKADKTVYWWNEEVASVHQKLKVARRRMRKYGYKDLRDIFNRVRWEFRKIVNKVKREEWQKFTSSISDPWDKLIKIVKATMSGRIQARTLCNIQGQFANDMGGTLDELGKQFFPAAEELTMHQKEVERRVEVELQVLDQVKDQGPKITTCEFRKALSEMSRATAPGLDRITNNIVIMLARDGRQESEYLDLFNLCLKHNYFPNIWKIAKIVLLPKPSTNPNTTKSFRPISLTSVFGKLFERIMLARLQHYITLSNALVPNQHAYSKGKSTQTALYDLFQTVQYALYRRSMCVVVFLDISGAFDCTWHTGILSKLLDYGVPIYMVRWMKSFLSNRKALFMDGGIEHEVQLEQGCPQGGVISPILWNILFNDLLAIPVEKGKKKSDCMKMIGYADDAAIVCKADTMDEISTLLNLQLDKIKQWADRHRIKFNNAKLAALTICNKSQPPAASNIMYDGVRIQQVQSYKYLGLLVDTRLSWSMHIDYVVSKLALVTRSLRGLSRETWGISLDVYRMLFNAIFKPVMTYGIVIWGWKATSKKVCMKFDKEIRKFALLATRCQKSSASTFLFSLMKTQSFADILQHEVLKVSIQQLHVTHTDRQCVYDNYASHRRTRVIPQCMDQQFYMYRRSIQNNVSQIEYNDDKQHFRVHPCMWASTKIVVRDMITAMWEGCDMKGWVLFTDASASSYGVGWSCVVYQHGICKMIRNGSLSKCSIFKAEAYAILQAARYANSIYGVGKKEIIEIRSDALGVVRSLEKCVHDDNLMLRIKEELRKAYHNGKNIVLKWVPSHRDISGNVQADFFAKKGVDARLTTKIGYTSKDLNVILKKKQKESLEDKWNQYNARVPKNFLPNYAALCRFISSSPTVALCQIVSGHTRLNEFVFRVLGLTSTPLCACTEASESVEHFLFECERYKEMRQLIFHGMENCEERYNIISKDWEKAADFVRMTGRFRGRCVADSGNRGGARIMASY